MERNYRMTNQVKTPKIQRLIPMPHLKPNMHWQDLFFHVLMFFHRPVAWSNRAIAAKLTFWATLVYGLWLLAAPAWAAGVSIGLLVFTLLDWRLLIWLPQANISFGPVNPQLMFMLVPRLLVAIAAAAVAYFGGTAWGISMFFGLEALGTLAYWWGLGVEPQRLTTTELTVTSPHLPTTAKPIRLLHLSDFHVERITQREAHILAYIEAAQPDVIVLTGDYLNASNRCDSEAIAQVRDLLGQLSASGGAYAVLGTPCVDLPYIAPLHFQENHIHLLRRDMIEVDLGDERRLTLLGLDCTHDLDYDGHLFSNLADLTPANTPTVFLYHSPELMPQVSQRNVDLYLCGHTHGGQLRVPGYGALFTSSATGKRYEMGRYDENGTTLYVSRGIGLEGFSMPRLRLFCPPEITMITIQGA